MPSLSKLVEPVVQILDKLAVFKLKRYFQPNTLTVLNYHRINNSSHMRFDTFKPNVSATPEAFARHMKYVGDNFNVITCQDLALYLRGEGTLPARAAMITFDDGYYDNYSNAFPILLNNKLPAVIFLSTEYMGRDTPFYWDYIAYCFKHTDRVQADLPLLGLCSWTDESSRDKVMMQWIEAIKKIPESEKREAFLQVKNTLEVIPPADAFSGLYLSWDQIREMSRSGLIEFGSHTLTHPILTRISPAEARHEVEESKKKIESEINKPVISLAYPNGGAADFSQDVINAVREAGIEMAFTLLPGPSSYKDVKTLPFEIRRIYISRKDTFARFILKINGLLRTRSN